MFWAIPSFMVVIFCLNYGRMSIKGGKIKHDGFYPVNNNNHRN